MCRIWNGAEISVRFCEIDHGKGKGVKIDVYRRHKKL